jgi:hypothetical protein
VQSQLQAVIDDSGRLEVACWRLDASTARLRASVVVRAITARTR